MQADVINQRRNLIDHLDAVELNPVTGKLDNYVTLFLLSDKILVAKRYDYVRGAEICSDNPINSFPVLGKNKSNKGLKFKFAGWIGLQHVELLKGGSDTPSDTFIIRASADFQEEVKKGDVKRNDKYFQSGAHLFTYQKHMDQLTSWNAHSARFIDSFYKTQAALRQRGDNDATYTSNWKQITNVYCNVFDPESYKKQHIKANLKKKHPRVARLGAPTPFFPLPNARHANHFFYFSSRHPLFFRVRSRRVCVCVS
ncbi:hypothetical protein BC940DRAFT_63911 [Gongronella butleri]|nr:hypothetical protein BC940DRAFT_63911 [Gongronella butleri]